MRSKLLADAIRLIFLLALPIPAFAFATDEVMYYFWAIILIFLVCIVRSIYLHSARKTIYTLIWIISVFSSVYYEIPGNIKTLVTIYLFISPAIILVLIFWRSNNKHQRGAKKKKMTTDSYSGPAIWRSAVLLRRHTVSMTRVQ